MSTHPIYSYNPLPLSDPRMCAQAGEDQDFIITAQKAAPVVAVIFCLLSFGLIKGAIVILVGRYVIQRLNASGSGPEILRTLFPGTSTPSTPPKPDPKPGTGPTPKLDKDTSTAFIKRGGTAQKKII